MAEKKKTEPRLIYETPESQYKKAVALMQEDELIVKYSYKKDNYIKAAEMFESVEDYNDAAELAKKCRILAEQADRDSLEKEYTFAVYEYEQAQTREDYERVIKLLEKAPGYKDADRLREEAGKKLDEYRRRSGIVKVIIGIILAAIVAVIIYLAHSGILGELRENLLGSSVDTADTEKTIPAWGEDAFRKEQPGDEVSFGSYQWGVLENDETTMLLVLYHAEKEADLRGRPYNEQFTDITWEDSTLREWLNSEFFSQAFSDEESDSILTETCENSDNPTFGTPGGLNTSDRVFLTSRADIEKYQDVFKTIRMNIWLRDPGHAGDTAMFMASNTRAMEYGYAVDSTDMYCVPMIRISLK